MKKINQIYLCCALCFLGVFALFVDESQAMPSNPVNNNQVVVVPSQLDFDSTRKKLLDFLSAKDLQLFAEFDHAKNAKDVDLELLPTSVFIFGNPTVGTKLMQNFHGIGLDLPLKVMLVQQEGGKVDIMYPNLAHSFGAYGVPEDHPIAAKMQGLMKALADTISK